MALTLGVPSASAAHGEDVMEPTPTPGGGCVVVSGGSGVGGTDSTDDSGLTGSGCVDSWVLSMLLAPGPVGGGPSAPPSSTPTCLVEIESIARAPDGTIIGAELNDLSNPACPQQPAAWLSEVSRHLRDIIRAGCNQPGDRIQWNYSRDRTGKPYLPRNFICVAGPGAPNS